MRFRQNISILAHRLPQKPYTLKSHFIFCVAGLHEQHLLFLSCSKWHCACALHEHIRKLHYGNKFHFEEDSSGGPSSILSLWRVLAFCVYLYHANICVAGTSFMWWSPMDWPTFASPTKPSMPKWPLLFFLIQRPNLTHGKRTHQRPRTAQRARSGHTHSFTAIHVGTRTSFSSSHFSTSFFHFLILFRFLFLFLLRCILMRSYSAQQIAVAPAFAMNDEFSRVLANQMVCGLSASTARTRTYTYPTRMRCTRTQAQEHTDLTSFFSLLCSIFVIPHFTLFYLQNIFSVSHVRILPLLL